MRKPATIFLLIVTFGMLFAGAATAQEPSTVNVTVVDQNGNHVTIASPGDEVAADVIATLNDGLIFDYVNISVDPDTGLQFEPEDARMWDTTKWIQNDPNDPFFYWNGASWIWKPNIATCSTQILVFELIAPAIVSDTGDITVNADLHVFNGGLIDSDSYTFLSVEPTPTTTANAATVPMQNTGAPIAVAMLGLLGIIGGTVYSRLR